MANDMIEDLIAETKQRMGKRLRAFEQELSKIRTGRAYPGLLEHITVSCYGGESPLTQVANIHVMDAHTLAVNVWDKAVVTEVEKAILSSDLGLNPAAAGQVVRVPLPPLTEERRKELFRMVKMTAEKARVAIRNVRRDTNQICKEKVKEKVISEDVEHKAMARAQKLTDDHIAKIEVILRDKETEIMAV